MLKVGLTGGIASGKSTVSKLFYERYHVPVIDADVVAREVVEPGKPALEAIAQQFGNQILTAKGELDRGRLRELVFSDPVHRQALEDILHPVIQREMLAQVNASSAPYCILAIPLLVETNQQHLVDRVLVVDVPEPVQVERLIARDNIAPEQAQAILNAQASREARLALADDVVTNTGSLDALAQQVARLHKSYLRLAESH